MVYKWKVSYGDCELGFILDNRHGKCIRMNQKVLSESLAFRNNWSDNDLFDAYSQIKHVLMRRKWKVSSIKLKTTFRFPITFLVFHTFLTLYKLHFINVITAKIWDGMIVYLILCFFTIRLNRVNQAYDCKAIHPIRNNNYHNCFAGEADNTTVLLVELEWGYSDLLYLIVFHMYFHLHADLMI